MQTKEQERKITDTLRTEMVAKAIMRASMADIIAMPFQLVALVLYLLFLLMLAVGGMLVLACVGAVVGVIVVFKTVIPENKK